MDINLIQTTYAKSRNEDREESEDWEELNEYYDNIPTQTNPITTVAPTVSTPTTNTNCRTVTETVYDTVTSASWTQSQVARQVSRQVCDTLPDPVVVPKIITPLITTESVPTIDSAVKNADFNDGKYTWTGKYSFPGGVVNYSVEINIISWKIVSAKFLSFTPSGNWLYTKTQWESALAKIVSSQNFHIDTVTWASGTSQAIQDAVDNALNQAKSITTTTNAGDTIPLPESYKAPNGKTYTILYEWGKVVIKKVDGSYAKKTFQTFDEAMIYLDQNAIPLPKLYNWLNWKSYTILYEWGKIVIKKSDGTYSKKTFQTFNEAVIYLDQNTFPAPKIYKAPNGKTYTILYEWGKVVIKKADGSCAKKTFQSYNEAVIYLIKNAPKKIVIVVKKTAVVKKITTPTVVKNVPTPATPITTAVKPVTPPVKPVVPTTPATTTTAS